MKVGVLRWSENVVLVSKSRTATLSVSLVKHLPHSLLNFKRSQQGHVSFVKKLLTAAASLHR